LGFPFSERCGIAPKAGPPEPLRDALAQHKDELGLVLAFGEGGQRAAAFSDVLFCHKAGKSWFRMAVSLFASAKLLISSAMEGARL